MEWKRILSSQYCFLKKKIVVLFYNYTKIVFLIVMQIMVEITPAIQHHNDMYQKKKMNFSKRVFF